MSMSGIPFYAQPENFKQSFGPHMPNWPKPECNSTFYLILDRGSLVPMAITAFDRCFIGSAWKGTFTLCRTLVDELKLATTSTEIQEVCRKHLPPHANPYAGDTLWMFYRAWAVSFAEVECAEVPGHEKHCKVIDLTRWTLLLRRKESQSF